MFPTVSFFGRKMAEIVDADLLLKSVYGQCSEVCFNLKNSVKELPIYYQH